MQLSQSSLFFAERAYVALSSTDDRDRIYGYLLAAFNTSDTPNPNLYAALINTYIYFRAAFWSN